MTEKQKRERYIDAYRSKARKLFRPFRTGRIADESGVLYGHLIGLLLVKREEEKAEVKHGN